MLHQFRLAWHLASLHAPPPVVGLLPRLKKSQRTVFKLIEYPKCGRSWLRFMINQAEAAAAGAPLLNALHSVPYAHLDLPRVGYAHGFKVGVPISKRSTTVETTGTALKGVILMVRQPERVMISYYHQVTTREPRLRYRGTLSEFIRDPMFGIGVYVEYVEHYLKALAGQNHMLMRYEDLLADTDGRFRDVLKFIGIELADETIEQIVVSSSFASMQAFEANGRLNPSWIRRASSDPASAKVRSGGRESIATHLSADDLHYIAAVFQSSEAFKRLSYVPEELA